jgi:hypothetical protein
MTKFKQHGSSLLAAGALLGALCSNPVMAQENSEEDLVTDRPDQTESAVTVAPGKVQVETGVLFTHDREGRRTVETTEALGTLVRIGLRDRIELRLGFDGFVSVPGASGFADTSVGAKFMLADETADRPQMAVLVASTVPVGEDGFTSDDYAPSARLALSKSFGEAVALGFNLGAEFPEGNEILIYTLAAGISVDDVNSVFVEVFGDSESSHSFDAGWTHLWRANLQFDLAAGLGITDEAPDWFLGAGVSIRFPR